MNETFAHTAGLTLLEKINKPRIQLNSFVDDYVISFCRNSKMSIIDDSLNTSPVELLKGFSTTTQAYLMANPNAAIPINNVEAAKKLIQVLQEYVDAEANEGAVNDGN
jgi:hypothetical protein